HQAEHGDTGAYQRYPQQPGLAALVQSVAQPAAEQTAQCCGATGDYPGENARALQRQIMGADQERGIPHGKGQPAETEPGAGSDQLAVVTVAQQLPGRAPQAETGRALLAACIEASA